jgi:hypothetical protein
MKNLDKIGTLLLKLASTIYCLIGWSAVADNTILIFLTLPVIVWAFNAIISYKS